MSAEEDKKSDAAVPAAAAKTSSKKDASASKAPKKKRGRPSKAELAARAKDEGAEAATNAAPTGTTGVSPVADATNAALPTGTTGDSPVADATNAALPAGTTGVSPVADTQQRVPPAAAAALAPAQPTISPPGEQPLSNRQRRRLEWLARAAQRNGNRPNFKGMGKHGGPMQPQGNRRPPAEVPQNLPPPLPAVPRNPDLPEYSLQDIHSWDNGEIVAKMWPDANPEDLGAMKRHEIIFGAIRSYLNRGGAVMATGCLEVVKEGYGFLRSAKTNFLACPEDVFIPLQQIRRHALRTGDTVEGPIRDPRDKDRFFALGNVVSVNGKTPSEAARIVHFENLVPTFPTRRIILETTPGEVSMRVVDLFTPIGFGQRGLIVAPPRVGKTVLLQKMANAITKNHPDAVLIVLLIDERPEEVTDMQRNTKAMVLSSTFDEEPQHHVNVAEMVIEMSRRQVENGKDVVILLDSITRLARAYNTVQPHSGKILTGGVDALALHRPKRFFGAARNIEGGGSLTIIATGLVDTGSRMDEVIFEEFKGTGNMELCLDRGLADRRIFPAIDIDKSGTRKEDLLLAPLELEKTWALRRALSDAGPERAMQTVLAGMKKYKSNPEFLLSIDTKNIY